jgi:hypothetical protein
VLTHPGAASAISAASRVHEDVVPESRPGARGGRRSRERVIAITRRAAAHARLARVADLLPLVPALLAALAGAQAGTVTHVPA